MDEKYNSGSALDIPENSNEMALAISEWSENNKSLENAIRSCIENNISTHASCAGHSLLDLPYLSLKVNKENLGQILNIMNSVANIKNTVIGLSYMKSQGTVLTITSDMMHRKSMFNTIAKASKKTVDIEDTMPIVQEIWDAHKELRLHDVGHSLEVQNSRFSKRLLVRPYSYYLYPILDESILKKDDYIGCYHKTFFRGKGLDTFLKSMLKNVADVCVKTKYDELGDTQQPENNFKESIKNPVEPLIIEEQNEIKTVNEREI